MGVNVQSSYEIGTQRRRLSSKNALARAIQYALSRWEALTRYAGNARLAIDNNVAERARRGIAITRKNFLFLGSEAGGERAAILYTVLQTAKLNGLDPEAYLADIIDRMAKGHPINRLMELLPWTAATGCQNGGMSADDIAVLRIELIDIEPLIWRRLAVPTATNLRTLHRIIQAAMGWQDYHLWEFTADDKTYGVPDPDDAGWGHKIERASSATLARLVESGVTAFDYTYDMGDDWAHRIIIERVEPAEPGMVYPDFRGGERRCPPEDCGSVPGYYEFLDAIAGPDKGKGSRRKKEMLAWYGRPYDPDDIDEAQIRAALKRLSTAGCRRSKTAHP